MLEQRRIAPPVDGLGVLRVDSDQLFDIGWDQPYRALHSGRQPKVFLAIGDHQIESAGRGRILPRK